ncbi:Uncharacterised protein [Klebsiella pneumoniae]|uniref:Uncharacterized protein n=1 Tax=Klebsiella pneumoniae TaxID=573 RepID=A0A378BY58_KLEPN|nr:Uncharacterised protein [Klebsiella pneumoniae]
MPERYQYPVDEGFADRIHTPEGVRSLVVKSQLMELLRKWSETATMSAVRRRNWWHWLTM